jgi:hypothetical protein
VKHTRFDGLAKEVSHSRSRRQVLRLLGGALAVGSAASLARPDRTAAVRGRRECGGPAAGCSNNSECCHGQNQHIHCIEGLCSEPRRRT